MSIVSKLLSPENPVFASYVTCSSVLVLKMMLMSPLTSIQRHKHAVIASPEDAKLLKGRELKTSHEDVERVRRAHLNDLENIPLFFFIGFAYVLTDPTPTTAINLFRVYAVARCIHTFVYAICVVPQPARGISWATGFFVTAYMAVKVIANFSNIACPLRSIRPF